MTDQLGDKRGSRQTNSKSSSPLISLTWSVSSIRCSDRQDRWYIFENHAEWRMGLVLVWRLSRSVALTSAWCLPSLFLDTLCVCSQRCRFMCDGLHDISCLAQVIKSSALHHPHFLNLVAERWGPDSGSNWPTGLIRQSSPSRTSGRDVYRQ